MAVIPLVQLQVASTVFFEPSWHLQPSSRDSAGTARTRLICAPLSLRARAAAAAGKQQQAAAGQPTTRDKFSNGLPNPSAPAIIIQSDLQQIQQLTPSHSHISSTGR